MAKKIKTPRARSDSERRSRQCERMARMLRTLKCIMGPGRWDAEALAKELECSVRTVQRILQTLAMAGVPFRYDSVRRSYEVQPGFKFPGIDVSQKKNPTLADPSQVHFTAKQVLKDGEAFMKSLRAFCEAVEE